VKLKTSSFQILTRQRSLPEPTDTAAELLEIACRLLREFGDRGPFRLVGLTAFDLLGTDERLQLGLSIELRPRARQLEATLDRVAERFGAGAVQRAGELIGDRGVGAGATLDFLATQGDVED
jgi:DNA polymerase-4